MSEGQESFAEDLERRRIHDEERDKLFAEMRGDVDISSLKRNLMIALLLYVSVSLVVVAGSAGLAVRVFLWASGV